MLLSTKELLAKFNVSYSKLTKLISRNHITGFWVGRSKKFDENEIELNLRDYNSSVTPFSLKYNPQKIKIINTYLELGSCRKVAKKLYVSRAVVTRTIKEYNESGSVEVESKLKNMKNG